MEEKIEIIDAICNLHPACGVDKGWSEYIGGMKDSGSWFFRKMLDVATDELRAFLKENSKPAEPAKRYSGDIVTVGASWYYVDEFNDMLKFQKELQERSFKLF